MLDIGKMKDRVTVEQLITKQDSFGQDIPLWDGIKDVWAAIKNLSGRQLALAQANTLTSTATHQISMHYLACLKANGKYRLRLPLSDGTFRTFSINNVNDPDNMHAELWLTATEVVT